MMYFDEEGFPRNETMDGMDSAMRAGMLATCSFIGRIRMDLSRYEKFDGLLCRHPLHSPSDNVWNFTRDQLIPLTAGMYFQHQHDIVRRVFYAHLGRFFFCQNFERDKPGSTKHPWPETFVDDDGTTKRRIFDFADPLMPDHVWHLVRAGRIWFLYWLAPIGIPWFIGSLFFHSRSSHKEHNQIICMAKVQGKWAVKLFKKMVPNWSHDVWEYWNSRNEPEYARLIIDDLENV